MKKDEPGEVPGAEPQSYGGNADWLSGRTGQTVDETPHKTSRKDEEFYRSKLEHRRSTAEAPARRSDVDESVEQDPSPDPSKMVEDIPRKPV